MSEYNKQGTGESFQNQLAGYILVGFMMIIIAVMVYAVYTSSQQPGIKETNTPITLPDETEIPAETPVIEPTEELETPTETETPEEMPTEEPVETSKPEFTSEPIFTPEPTPELTFTPEPVKVTPSPEPEKVFQAAAPDGPPLLEKAYGDPFKGKRGKASIIVNAKDWGSAQVYLIDNTRKNFRPLEFTRNDQVDNQYRCDVPPGNYSIKIVKNGYFTFNAQLQLFDGDIAEINEPLDRRPTLDLTSRPTDAKVYIDGMFAGKTPLVIYNLDDREYKIRVIKPGYQTKNFSLKFERGKGIKKVVTLAPEK